MDFQDNNDTGVSTHQSYKFGQNFFVLIKLDSSPD